MSSSASLEKRFGLSVESNFVTASLDDFDDSSLFDVEKRDEGVEVVDQNKEQRGLILIQQNFVPGKKKLFVGLSDREPSRFFPVSRPSLLFSI